MQIKIFTGTPSEVEKRVNRFAKTVQVIGVQQSVCCDNCTCDNCPITIIVTVSYYEHCDHKFYGIKF